MIRTSNLTLENCIKTFLQSELIQEVSCPVCTAHKHKHTHENEGQDIRYDNKMNGSTSKISSSSFSSSSSMNKLTNQQQETEMLIAMAQATDCKGDVDRIHEFLDIDEADATSICALHNTNTNTKTQLYTTTTTVNNKMPLSSPCPSFGSIPVPVPVPADSNLVQKVNTSTKKSTCFARLPPILCFHINRNIWNGATGHMKKNDQLILFQEVLDMAEYLKPSGAGAGCYKIQNINQLQRSQKQKTINGDNKQHDNSNGNSSNSNSNSNGNNNRTPTYKNLLVSCKYTLFSVIEHIGTANQGHYVTYSKVNTVWKRFSDEDVRDASWKSVKGCNAYMLLYVKDD